MSQDHEPYLTVEVTGDHIVAERAGGGGTKPVPLPLKRDSLEMQTIDLLKNLLKGGDEGGFFITDIKQDIVKVLGQYLYNVLFVGEIGNLLTEALNDAGKKVGADGKRQRLRIILHLEGATEELASYPWEYLYINRGDGKSPFLSNRADLVLARYVRLKVNESSLKYNGNLNILLAYAKPKDKSPVPAEAVLEMIEDHIKALKEKFTELGNSISIDVKPLDHVTAKEFIKWMSDEDYKPHILHFISHGKFDGKKGWVAFEDEDTGEAAWYDETQFARWCSRGDEQSLMLTFLHLCEGGVVNFYKGMNGLAPKLIKEANVPAVVAMQYPVRSDFALKFASAFYTELVRGLEVGSAVQEGRKAIFLDPDFDARDFATPVLYLRSTDGMIRIDRATPAVPPGKSVTEPTRSQLGVSMQGQAAPAAIPPSTSPPPFATSTGFEGGASKPVIDPAAQDQMRRKRMRIEDLLYRLRQKATELVETMPTDQWKNIMAEMRDWMYMYPEDEWKPFFSTVRERSNDETYCLLCDRLVLLIDVPGDS
jgi:hypothetical protein